MSARNGWRWALSLVLTVAVGGSDVSAQTTCEMPEALLDFSYFPFHVTGLSSTVKAGILFEPGDTSLVRRVQERPEASAAWTAQETEYSTSFTITAVSWREGGDVLYIAGFDKRTCLDVIEEWTFTKRTGAPVLHAAASPASTPPVPPMGTPAPPFALNSTIVGGGDYLEPGERVGLQPPPQRRVLIGGTSFGRLRGVVADPEGRFLLFLAHGTSGIYQLDLMAEPPEAPVLLYTPSDAGPLADVRTMQIFEHKTLPGRHVILTESQHGVLKEGAEFVVLSDPENDGAFNSIQSFDAQEWSAGPYSDGSLLVGFVKTADYVSPIDLEN